MTIEPLESAPRFTREERKALDKLRLMLCYKRPHGSIAEKVFIKRYLTPLGVKEDGGGNLYKRIGESNILWSCHTDTVHRESGTQMVVEKKGLLQLDKDEKSNCLGADCTTGVWLMCAMIAHKVPGLYVFHYGEESGCIGSRWIAKENPGFLHGIDYAIAFDRRGNDSVITHQMSSRCCSDAFAKAFAQRLADAGLKGYTTDPHGSYTDTAQYVDLVAECTNIGVGYRNQHCVTETQDMLHAVRLRAALLRGDFSNLPVVRDPSAREYLSDWKGSTYGGYGGRYGGWGHREWNDSDWYSRTPSSNVRHFPTVKRAYIKDNEWRYDDDYRGNRIDSESARESEVALLRELVRDHPDSIAYLLETLSVSTEDVFEAISYCEGHLPQTYYRNLKG